MMGKTRWNGAKGFEYLDLHRRIGDVVLAPHHIAHAEIDVVQNRGQRVEKGAVGPHQDGIGEAGRVHCCGPRTPSSHATRR